MGEILRYVGQGLAYALFAAGIGYFSTSPAHVVRREENAVVKLAVTHAGQPAQPCRARSEEELARLAPNMRTPLDCPRARSPVEIRLELDGKPLYSAQVPPAGLARDGVSSVYRRFTVPHGVHRVRAALKDHLDLAEFNFTTDAEVTLAPGEVLVIDFQPSRGGFVFR